MAEIKTEDGKKDKYYLYYDGETVSGKVCLMFNVLLLNVSLFTFDLFANQVNVTLKKPGAKMEHQGIKVEFIGEIELYQDRGNHHEFTSLVKDLARPGEMTQNTSFSFEFVNVEKPYESYTGSNVRLRFVLKRMIKISFN